MPTSHARKPIPLLKDYTGEANPLIASEFIPGKGWIAQGWRKMATESWLRKIQKAGVTHIAVGLGGWGGHPRREADFSVAELLKSAAQARKAAKAIQS